MTIRNNVLQKITEVFKKHGAECIDTPVFELKVNAFAVLKFVFVGIYTII